MQVKSSNHQIIKSKQTFGLISATSQAAWSSSGNLPEGFQLSHAGHDNPPKTRRWEIDNPFQQRMTCTVAKR